jgi:hypothetical protein
MKLAGVLLSFAVLAAGWHSAAADGAAAPPPGSCVQAKARELSYAAMWDGPPIDEALTAWRNDAAVEGLVRRLAAQGIPAEEVQKDITDFAAAAGAGKTARSMLLFAGLFDTLNRQRTETIDRLERLERHSRFITARLRANTLALRMLGGSQSNDARVNRIKLMVERDTAILNDHQKVAQSICEVPAAIESRLAALARTIRQGME